MDCFLDFPGTLERNGLSRSHPAFCNLGFYFAKIFPSIRLIGRHARSAEIKPVFYRPEILRRLFI